jgi:AraC-like DNA-binding protein
MAAAPRKELAQTVPLVSVNAVLQGMAALGLDADALAKRAGLAGADRRGFTALARQVPKSAMVALWQLAKRETGNETLETDVAEAIPAGAFGPLEYMARSAPTFGEAVRRTAAMFALVGRAMNLEIACDGDRHRLTVIHSKTAPDAYVDTPSELLFAVVLARARQLLGAPALPLCVRLRRRLPRSVAGHQRAFGLVPEYGAPYNEMVFDSNVWFARLPTGDAALATLIEALVRESGMYAGGRDMLSETRALLRTVVDEMDERALLLPEVARRLGLSTRTMQRRLAEQGTRFDNVVDDFRRDVALRLLDDPKIPLQSLPSRLGLRDRSSFYRAFRRWTGVSPTQWRQARSGGAPTGGQD